MGHKTQLAHYRTYLGHVCHYYNPKTYKVQFSCLQQLLSLDGVLLDVDSDREDRVGARGLGIEQCGGRLSLGPALVQDCIHLVFGMDLQLVQPVDHNRTLTQVSHNHVHSQS